MEINYLKKIKSPDDVKKLDGKQLETLCEEIRQEMISTVCKNGGHLASNLGMVELTVALHRAFNSPDDKIIFDVSHQCYTHKMLTGRFEEFHTLRTQGGITGFTNPRESEHDVFISGHSSTSISSGLGLAVAENIDKSKNYVVSVIGDGALGGGMAYEALNNASRLKTKLIVVLNDNKMSISKNVGAMSRHLAVLRSRPSYFRFKTKAEKTIIRVPVFGRPVRNFIHRIKTGLKNTIYGSSIFESMGFSYLGPIDGHDIEKLEDCFKIAKMSKRPAFIHVLTVKGKGYSFAEQTPKDYHGVSSGTDIDTGESKPSDDSFSYCFGQTLCRIAAENEKVCAVTAAMTDGVGLSEFSKKYPKRFFDVGIAEEHAVTFCSGLSKGGKIPVLAVYSPFLQRAYDQIIHDISTQGLKMIICVDRAGFNGEDGETHQGVFDVAFLSTVPNVEIYSPCSYSELEGILKKCVDDSRQKLFVIRYPKGKQEDLCKKINQNAEDYKVIGNGSKTAVVVYGRVFPHTLRAELALKKVKKDVDVIYLNRIHPIPKQAVKAAMEYDKLFFFEEGMKNGSVSQQFIFELSTAGYKGDVFLTAIDEEYVPVADVKKSLENYGLSDRKIFEYILKNR